VGVKLSTDFLDKWKHIINTVDKTDIPTHLIDKVVIRLFGPEEEVENKQIINISTLKEQGFHEDEIEEVINETLWELNDFIDSVDFFLDIEAVAQEVQPETDKMLNTSFNNLKE
jgi:hypothetical protein